MIIIEYIYTRFVPDSSMCLFRFVHIKWMDFTNIPGLFKHVFKLFLFSEKMIKPSLFDMSFFSGVLSLNRIQYVSHGSTVAFIDPTG